MPRRTETTDEIPTLDDSLPQLSQHASFARRLATDHPLCIGTNYLQVRLCMMMPQGESAPRVIGTTDPGTSTNRPAQALSPSQLVQANFCIEGRLWPGPVLCYGDVVALRLAAGGTATATPEHLYLQVSAAQPKPTLSETSLWELSCRPAPQDAVWNLWTLLPRLEQDGGDDVLPLLVGWSATQKPAQSTGVPVRVGDATLLRHVKTGGLLSLSSSDGGILQLMTDSFQSAGNLEATGGTALGRLQRHDLLLPTQQEAVWLQASSTPANIPSWHLVGQQRIFLQAEYLAKAERHLYENETHEGERERMLGTRGIAQQQLTTPVGQEQALIDQLLGSFVGLEASLISRRPSEDGMEAFAVEGWDPHLSKLAMDLLSLSNDYVTVRRFVAAQYPGYAYGMVRQAFGAALENCLHEYLELLSRVESQYRQGPFGMHQLQVMLRPAQDCLRVLCRTVEVTEGELGGSMLNALRRLRIDSYDGDNVGQEVVNRLLRESSVPYMMMLQQWLESGILDDPHGEFMVQKSDTVKEWEHCFVVLPHHVLEGFFSTYHAREAVLPTGRYWQAIESCRPRGPSSDRTSDGISALSYDANPAAVASYVQTQYRRASDELVKLLLVEYDLVGALRLIKRYFLLDQGDFFVNFMDSAEGDLNVARDKLSLGRLQHWLGLSVQLTEQTSDEEWAASISHSVNDGKLLANVLRCHLADYGLIDRLDRLHLETGGIDTTDPGTPQRRIYNKTEDAQQTGVDVFCIEFPSIPSPLSLILSPTVMDNYQLLFRSLFFAKHVERRLVSVWRDHLALKELPTLRGSMGRTFLLRQRMLHCLQHLIYYMMFEVIEPNWAELENAITGKSTESKEHTVDDILRLHGLFMERTMEACLITSRELLSSLMRLMRTCLLFADQMNLFMKSIGIHQDRQNLAMEKQKRVQQGLSDWKSKRRNNDKVLRETLRKDYLDRQRRVLEHTRRVQREVTVTTYTAMIDRHEEVFNQQLKEFMNLLSHSDDLYHTQKVNLCFSLDYNGFAQMPTKTGLNEGGGQSSGTLS